MVSACCHGVYLLLEKSEKESKEQTRKCWLSVSATKNVKLHCNSKWRVETLDRRVGVGLSEEATMNRGLNKDLEGKPF